MNLSQNHDISADLSEQFSNHLRMAAHTAAQNWIRYSAIVGIGFVSVLVMTFVGATLLLALVALVALLGGVSAHIGLAVKTGAVRREVDVLEERLSSEASASRMLAGIKLLISETSLGSRGRSLSADARLAAAARMATEYSAAVVFNLNAAHGVFAPSNWNYDGQLSQIRDEFEPVDGGTPGAVASRQGAAIVISLTDRTSTDLPGWAEQAGFTQGIVSPISRGLDTVGIVYVFNKSQNLPTLNEIEQLELIVSFGSGFSSNPWHARTNGQIATTGNIPGGSVEPKTQPFRVVGTQPGRTTSVKTQIRMPGFALVPELERMELAGTPLSLSPTEFLLVHALASSPGKPVSPVELMNSCWSKDSRPADNAVDVAIFRLRRKLSKSDMGKGLIKTVRGSGYMFVPPVVESTTPVIAD